MVTGASSGIGRAGALALAEAGADIVVNGHSQMQKAGRWHQIEAMGEGAIAVRADVSKPADVDRLVTQTVDTMGKVDILFNNAGIIRLHRWKSTATRYGSEPSTSILQATSSVAVGSSLR